MLNAHIMMDMIHVRSSSAIRRLNQVVLLLQQKGFVWFMMENAKKWKSVRILEMQI